MKRLEQCVQQGRRVCIVLRGRNSVNSFILAKIVAFDKHWNLLIRDGDESFKPPARMKRRITKSTPITGSCRYFESKAEDWEGKTKTIWRRHLSCSLIRGDDIVLILISPRFSGYYGMVSRKTQQEVTYQIPESFFAFGRATLTDE